MNGVVKTENYNQPATPRQLRKLLELWLSPGVTRPHRGPTGKLLRRLEKQARKWRTT